MRSYFYYILIGYYLLGTVFNDYYVEQLARYGWNHNPLVFIGSLLYSVVFAPLRAAPVNLCLLLLVFLISYIYIKRTRNLVYLLTPLICSILGFFHFYPQYSFGPSLVLKRKVELENQKKDEVIRNRNKANAQSLNEMAKSRYDEMKIYFGRGDRRSRVSDVAYFIEVGELGFMPGRSGRPFVTNISAPKPATGSSYRRMWCSRRDLNSHAREGTRSLV